MDYLEYYWFYIGIDRRHIVSAFAADVLMFGIIHGVIYALTTVWAITRQLNKHDKIA